jgi:hypothetical protein
MGAERYGSFEQGCGSGQKTAELPSVTKERAASRFFCVSIRGDHCREATAKGGDRMQVAQAKKVGTMTLREQTTQQPIRGVIRLLPKISDENLNRLPQFGLWLSEVRLRRPLLPIHGGTPSQRRLCKHEDSKEFSRTLRKTVDGGLADREEGVPAGRPFTFPPNLHTLLSPERQEDQPQWIGR